MGCSQRAAKPSGSTVAAQPAEPQTAVATDSAAATPAPAPAAETRERSRTALLERRKAQIARLHAYAKAGVFPVNGINANPIHMFRDSAGHLCAIANLVYKDGLVAVVDRAAREHNDVTVADEQAGALHDWVLTSGLTREEVRRIQYPAYYEAIGELERQRAKTTKRLLEVEAELVAASDESVAVALSRLEEATPPDALANLDVEIRKAQVEAPPRNARSGRPGSPVMGLAHALLDQVTRFVEPRADHRQKPRRAA